MDLVTCGLTGLEQLCWAGNFWGCHSPHAPRVNPKIREKLFTSLPSFHPKISLKNECTSVCCNFQTSSNPMPRHEEHCTGIPSMQILLQGADFHSIVWHRKNCCCYFWSVCASTIGQRCHSPPAGDTAHLSSLILPQCLPAMVFQVFDYQTQLGGSWVSQGCVLRPGSLKPLRPQQQNPHFRCL